MEAIDKLRNIVAWADYQNEHFNQKFKSVSDIEAVYNFCMENNLEFIDDLHLFDQEGCKKVEKLLGYSIY